MSQYFARTWPCLLIILGLCGTALSAAAAYWVRLDLADEVLATLTLAGDAGRAPDQKEGARGGQPLVFASSDAGEALALRGELLQSLRENRWLDEQGRARQLRIVRVREFRWNTWRGRWWFLGSLLAMLAGAWAYRWTTRTGDLVDAEHRQELLLTAFRALERALEDLQTEVRRRPERGRQQAAILRWGDHIQGREAANFVERCQQGLQGADAARSVLMLEHFATTERYLNRAWSAAADEDIPEALDALEIAVRNLLEMESLVNAHD